VSLPVLPKLNNGVPSSLERVRNFEVLARRGRA